VSFRCDGCCESDPLIPEEVDAEGESAGTALGLDAGHDGCRFWPGGEFVGPVVLVAEQDGIGACVHEDIDVVPDVPDESRYASASS
jgi:hypothetical protein